MICPRCGNPFDNRLTDCPICRAPVAADETGHAQKQNIRFVTVYEAGDPAFLAFAKSVLQAEGIPYYFKGEYLQDLDGAGRLGTGFNPLFGQVQIQVDEKDAIRARDILQQLEQSKINISESESEDRSIKNEEHPMEIGGKKKSKGILAGVVIGIFISLAAYYIDNAIQEYRQKNTSWYSSHDTNRDGKNDVFYYYDKGDLYRMEEDRNYDGKIDTKWFYKEGILDYGLLDENYDGAFEAKHYYAKGLLERIIYDADRDKNPEVVENYVNGVLYDALFYHEKTGKVWKKASYRHGEIFMEQIDENYDGIFDVEIRYNEFSRPIKTSRLK